MLYCAFYNVTLWLKELNITYFAQIHNQLHLVLKYLEHLKIEHSRELKICLQAGKYFLQVIGKMDFGIENDCKHHE